MWQRGYQKQPRFCMVFMVSQPMLCCESAVVDKENSCRTEAAFVQSCATVGVCESAAVDAARPTRITTGSRPVMATILRASPIRVEALECC